MNSMWSHRRPIAAFLFLELCLLATSSATEAGKYVEVDDNVYLYYEESGEGRPIVFVPGWTGTHRFFSKQLDHFEESGSARAIVYDPRAHGRSTKTLEGAFYAQHARDLKAFIDALDLQDVTLVGWSWGGVTVYAYLNQFGTDNLKGVVIIDQTPTPLAPVGETWGDGGAETFAQFFDDFTADRIATVTGFIPWMYSKGVDESNADWMLAETMMTPDVVASQLLYDGWMRDWSETFMKVDVPMLHFVREENGPVAESFIQENKPEAEIVVMGGHGMFWDHAEEFNEALEAFVAKAD